MKNLKYIIPILALTMTVANINAEEVKGENGFGFDEIFELESGKTLAQITSEEKNRISARKIALEKLRKQLLELETER